MSEISVVIPCFNSADTLKRAVASIAAQTHPVREVIIVDDGSTDETLNVARSIAHENPQLNCVIVDLGRNLGPGTARNAGWDRATGSFVAFLDADDAWHPRKLGVQHAVMAANPRCVLSGHRYRVDSSGALGDIGSERPGVILVTLRSLLVRNAFSTPSVMLRRDVVQRFNPSRDMTEDYLLWLEVVADNGPALLIDAPLTTLFKAPYGESGLSSQLHRMERKELTALRHLRRSGSISMVTWLWSSLWSIVKYVRRIVVVAARRR